MRIALDLRTATDHFPGIGRYAASLARAMVPLLGDGQELLLLCQSGEGNASKLKHGAKQRVLVVEVPSSPFALSQQWTVPSALRRCAASLYHSPYYLMPYRPGVPTVVTIYDLIPLLLPKHFALATRVLFRVLTRMAIGAAGHIAVISEATRRDLLARYRLPAEKVTVIPLAVAPGFQPQPREMVRTLCARLDIAGRYVLYVGTDKPHKNLRRLLEAWARLQPTGLPLVLAGFRNHGYPKLRRLVEELALDGVVRFLGPVAEEDLPALYSGALVFAFPSEYEGFGLPVLEAMACGVPVLTTTASSLPEVAGDAAVLVDAYEVEALARGLGELLGREELRRYLVEKGLRRAKEFSWERCARETLRVYRQAVSA
jgi:glycosyltransferase involved in cell wall biosynthesis